MCMKTDSSTEMTKIISLLSLPALVPPNSDSDFDSQLKDSLLSLSEMSSALATGACVTYMKSDFENNTCIKPSIILNLINESNFEAYVLLKRQIVFLQFLFYAAFFFLRHSFRVD